MPSSAAPLDPSASLPALLACLPTAFASPKPPPALLPLLSPILSQRIQLLSELPSTKSWLPLLNWDDQEAAQLPKIIESASLEPHPVSGEIELGSEPEDAKYRRIDEETLQGLVNIPETGLAVVYVWAVTGESQAWKVSELKPLHAGWQRNPTPWANSIPAAEDAFEGKTHGPAILAQLANGEDTQVDQDEEEDDGYWDRYDATPGRTPGQQSPAPNTRQQQAARSSLRPSGTEDSYWGQYGSVQPALDAEDPDEEGDGDAAGQSTLNGSTILGSQRPGHTITEELDPPARSMFTPNGSKSNGQITTDDDTSTFMPNGTHTAESGVAFGLQAFLGNHGGAFHSTDDSSFEHIAHPRPRSQSAHSSDSGKSALVEQLEDQVEPQRQYGAGDGRKNSVVAEFAIQQHISTSMKSLFRLAKGAGMQRAEFERIVQNELGVLGILDEE